MHHNEKANPEQLNLSRLLLDEAYKVLEYDEGALYDAASLPDKHSMGEWVNKGDWLSLAAELGAEKVFFVNNDPVIIFCTQETSDAKQLSDLFRRYWCMARPQCLFLAVPGELRVYSLNQEPVRGEDWHTVKTLDIVTRVADVAETLQAYHRERVETGQLFQEKRFGDIEQRADKRLIQDLKFVRKALLKAGLEPRHAHALIGRSIFIRYLEDREVLTLDYFEGIAEQNALWQEKLSQTYTQPIFSSTTHERWYHQVLQDKNFTYALFRQLAEDFNGDMFPRDHEEESAVDQAHLDLLRNFLLGNSHPHQPALFLWAYDFDIVPTELISNIYEEFYHANNDDDKGTHYTPAVLVEYVLKEVLTDEILMSNPRILDPACGSGIFLVEAFRRIVRSQVQQLGRPLIADELRNILKWQLAGIEINTEAVHVAAFSLYLALLHYQNPPDIRQNPRLPRLIFRPDQTDDVDDLGILFNCDAFSLTEAEFTKLTIKLKDNPRFRGRSDLEKFINISTTLPLDEKCFDVVVGNPPWGAAKGITEQIQKGWCNAFGWTIGGKEPSQAFIARILSLLKSAGVCGLLVSTGVFFKSHDNSEGFRQAWLKQVTLKKVVNFAHVRHVFFNADSPFAFVHFEAKQAPVGNKFQYWSAKRTEIIDKLQILVLNLSDLRQVRQNEIEESSFLWKTYWWGNHHDAALIHTLKLYSSLEEIIEQRGWGSIHRGFQGAIESATPRPSLWLSNYKELPSDFFRRFGPVPQDKLMAVPPSVNRRGIRDIYEGWRILVKRIQNEPGSPSGTIVARLDNIDYSFKNTIFGFSVATAADWERKIIIGILWSSLARYFLFLISGGWGIYHYEIHLEELKTLPLVFPKSADLRNRIIEIVNQLMAWSYNSLEMQFDVAKSSNLAYLQQQLDEAIFEMYGLSQAERELVEDMCSIGLETLYRNTSKDAMSGITLDIPGSHGNIRDLAVEASSEPSMRNYLHTFLQVWNRELEPTGEFSWNVIYADNAPMLAVIFTTQDKGASPINYEHSDSPDWNEVLKRCARALRQPISQSIFIDGMARVVTDTEIYIIKRDERRLWTRSMAREDAEATRLQAMHLQAPETV